MGQAEDEAKNVSNEALAEREEQDSHEKRYGYQNNVLNPQCGAVVGKCLRCLVSSSVIQSHLTAMAMERGDSRSAHSLPGRKPLSFM